MAQSNNDDTGNDLALTVDDIFTGKIGTPLLKPLEEEDDDERTSDIGQSPSVATSISSSSSASVSSPAVRTQPLTTVASSSTTSIPASAKPPKETELKKELDHFFMVMNKVERAEKAKERRASLSSFPFPPPGTIMPATNQSSPAHLISPPPYSNAQSSSPHPSLPNNGHHPQLRQYLNSSIGPTSIAHPSPSQESVYSTLANPPLSDTTSSFAKPRSLPLSDNLYAAPTHLQHHLPTSSPHTPILISPTGSHLLPCSTSHPLPPTPTTPYDPITGFHHQPPQARPGQIQPLTDYSQPLGGFSGPQQQPAQNQTFNYNMTEPPGPSWSHPAASYHQYVPGQKRPISSSQYMPPAKVPLSTIAQVPNGTHGNQMLGHYLPNHTGVTPIPSYPNEPPPYPHM